MRTGRRYFKHGQRVKICDFSGLDSGKTGTIVPVRKNYRGIPLDVQGAYHPFRPNKEAYIRLDDGTHTTMFFDRLSHI